MLPLTEAFYYILLTLHLKPAHGYGIMQDVEQMSNGRVLIGAGTLYTALNTLVKKGLIQAAELGEEMDTRRKMYAITTFGILTLNAEMMRLAELLQNGRTVLSQKGSQDNDPQN